MGNSRSIARPPLLCSLGMQSVSVRRCYVSENSQSGVRRIQIELFENEPDARYWRIFVKLKVMYVATCVMLFASLMNAATPTRQIPAGKKAKVNGTIVSRNGDMVNVKEKKGGQVVIVNLTDNTKVEREKGAL